MAPVHTITIYFDAKLADGAPGPIDTSSVRAFWTSVGQIKSIVYFRDVAEMWTTNPARPYVIFRAHANILEEELIAIETVLENKSELVCVEPLVQRGTESLGKDAFMDITRHRSNRPDQHFFV